MQPDDGRHCTGDGCAIGHKSPVNMQPGNGCHQSRLSRSPVDGSRSPISLVDMQPAAMEPG